MNADDLLKETADYLRAQSDPQYCLDEVPNCNLCGRDMASARFMIDGEVKGTPQTSLPNGASAGQWAYMCATCFNVHGVAIKWGRGQLYERNSGGEWLLVGGFPPPDVHDHL